MGAIRLPEDLEQRRLLFKHALEGVDVLEQAAVTAAGELRAHLKLARRHVETFEGLLAQSEALVETCQRIKGDLRPQLGAIRRRQDATYEELAIARGDADDEQGMLL